MRIRGFLSLCLATLALSVIGTAAAQAGSDSAPLSIAVKDSSFIDSQGKPVQLRGANISGLEYIAVQGWSPQDPAGDRYTDKILAALVSWGGNVVRLPLNQASWLGYRCVDGLGKLVNPDPGGNYRETVKAIVERATRRGLYIIVDLHWSAPDDPLRAVSGIKAMCPMGQNPMPDRDHSIEFWRSVAETFKTYPNMMFELFNEPFFDWKYSSKNDAEILRDGGPFSGYVTGQGFIAGHSWNAAGMQILLTTVRQTGATNVILVGAPDWSKRLEDWLTYRVKDPLNQVAAVWHAYPAWETKWGTEEYQLPNYGKDAFKWAEAIVTAKIPVIITETGDKNSPGTKGAPFVSRVLPWADRWGMSYLGWTFNVWPDVHENVLLLDTSGKPTPGYGQYFQQHLKCRAAGSASCP